MDFAPSRPDARVPRADAGLHGRGGLPRRAGLRPAAPRTRRRRRALHAAAGRRGPEGRARSAGLWNLFLPDSTDPGARAIRPRVRARSPSCPAAPSRSRRRPSTARRRTPGTWRSCTCSARPSRRSAGSSPLLDGRIRSAFGMTEPDVASSDATNISTTIRRDGDEYVINGRKWWTTGLNDPRCDGHDRHGQDRSRGRPSTTSSRWCSCPSDTPGVEILRSRPGVRLSRPARPRRGPADRRAGAGRRTCSATRAAASPSPRPGSDPVASITACARSGWPSAPWT